MEAAASMKRWRYGHLESKQETPLAHGVLAIFLAAAALGFCFCCCCCCCCGRKSKLNSSLAADWPKEERARSNPEWSEWSLGRAKAALAAGGDCCCLCVFLLEATEEVAMAAAPRIG